VRLSRFPLPIALISCALLASACGQLTPLTTRQALDRFNVSTTKVYDADGNVIANLHGEIDRDIVPLAQIPPPVRDAVVAIEDERFYTHQGIDLRSIVRAIKENARAAEQGGGGVQGGSTITQQLAKNLYFSRPGRTIGRKVAEARVTLQLERTYSKDRILEMYLNTIYLGRGVYGIEAAAHSYFGKPASALTLADAAFLAGLIHEPGRYEWSPSDPPARQAERRAAGIARRRLVLETMERLHFISRQDEHAADESPLQLKPVGEDHWSHPYFVDLVLRQLGVLRSRSTDPLDPRFDFLGRTATERAARAYRGGLRIYTTLDPRAQAAAEHAVQSGLPSDLSRLSAALVAIEPSTGYVRALVGGRDYYPSCAKSSASQVCRLARVNLALGDEGGGSGRQPGSSFKPFVLTAALERGVPLNQEYSGDEFTYSYQGGTWTVHNYEGEEGGYHDLTDGTAHSINAVFAHLEIDGVGDGNGLTGAQRVATVARRMGVGLPTPDQLRARCGADYLRTDACLPADDTPAIALGAKEVSPYDMASAYATFADDGIRVEPTAIVRITDPEGRVLYQAQPDHARVIPAGVARAATSVLTSVIQRGTGTAAAIGRPAAGKTGTSQGWRDAWFDGFVPQLAASVWVGNPIPIPGEGIESMTPDNGYPFKVVGGTFPAQIWHDFMSRALDGIPMRDFALPPAVFFNGLSGSSSSPTPLPQATALTIGGVPDVVGTSLRRGSAEVSAAGFRAAPVEECDPTGNAAPGDIWRQDPGGGSSAPQGSTVSLWYGSDGCG
jgi:penicillin-binding protein 1A